MCANVYVFQAEGLTAIEAWMLACILFVFAALAEYAALLFHKSKKLLEKPAVHNQYQVQLLFNRTVYTTSTRNSYYPTVQCTQPVPGTVII